METDKTKLDQIDYWLNVYKDIDNLTNCYHKILNKHNYRKSDFINQDALNNAYITLFEKIKTGFKISNIQAYLNRSFYNESIDNYKKSQIESTQFECFEENNLQSDLSKISKTEKQVYFARLNLVYNRLNKGKYQSKKIKKQYIKIFTLYFVKGYTQKQISKKTGIKQGNLSLMINRLKYRLDNLNIKELYEAKLAETRKAESLTKYPFINTSFNKQGRKNMERLTKYEKPVYKWKGKVDKKGKRIIEKIEQPINKGYGFKGYEVTSVLRQKYIENNNYFIPMKYHVDNLFKNLDLNQTGLKPDTFKAEIKDIFNISIGMPFYTNIEYDKSKGCFVKSQYQPKSNNLKSIQTIGYQSICSSVCFDNKKHTSFKPVLIQPVRIDNNPIKVKRAYAQGFFHIYSYDKSYCLRVKNQNEINRLYSETSNIKKPVYNPIWISGYGYEYFDETGKALKPKTIDTSHRETKTYYITMPQLAIYNRFKTENRLTLIDSYRLPIKRVETITLTHLKTLKPYKIRLTQHLV